MLCPYLPHMGYFKVELIITNKCSSKQNKCANCQTVLLHLTQLKRSIRSVFAIVSTNRDQLSNKGEIWSTGGSRKRKLPGARVHRQKEARKE